MTPITERMIKSGTLHSTEAEAQIYQDGDEFFYQVSGWTVVDFEEQDYTSESTRYPSLDALLSDLPRGIHYLPEGVTETTQEIVKRFLEATEHIDYTEEFQRIDAERMAEFGTTDFLEITAILEERKKQAAAPNSDESHHSQSNE